MSNRFKGWTTGEHLAFSPSAKKAGKAKPRKGTLTAELLAQRQRASVLIGIDPGVKTGFVCKEFGNWHSVETLPIYMAINRIIEWTKVYGAENIFVRIEDARLRTWFGETSRERLKGAGSVERDCKIWEEVLTELEIPFEFVHPKNVKATTAEAFKKMTGWQGRTSIHAREAAWLIL